MLTKLFKEDEGQYCMRCQTDERRDVPFEKSKGALLGCVRDDVHYALHRYRGRVSMRTGDVTSFTKR